MRDALAGSCAVVAEEKINATATAKFATASRICRTRSNINAGCGGSSRLALTILNEDRFAAEPGKFADRMGWMRDASQSRSLDSRQVKPGHT